MDETEGVNQRDRQQTLSRQALAFTAQVGRKGDGEGFSSFVEIGTSNPSQGINEPPANWETVKVPLLAKISPHTDVIIHALRCHLSFAGADHPLGWEKED